MPSSGVSTPLTSSPSLFSSSPSLLSNPTIGDSAKNCTTCGKKTRRDACTADDPSGQLGQQDGDGSVLRQGPLPPPQAPQSDLHFAGVDGNVGGQVGRTTWSVGAYSDGSWAHTGVTWTDGATPKFGFGASADVNGVFAVPGAHVDDVVLGPSFGGSGGPLIGTPIGGVGVSAAGNASGVMVGPSLSTPGGPSIGATDTHSFWKGN